MDVKKAVKKVVAMGAGASMLGATVLGAMAADLSDYPAPFVSGGQFNALIVVGANSRSIDTIGAVDIATGLQAAGSGAATTSTSTTVAVSGESASLNSGGDKIYIADVLNEHVTTITDNELPTTLADGSFEDNSGTETDYQQQINIGATPAFTYGDSGNDLDDPELIIALGTSTTNFIYEWDLTFDTTLDFTDNDVQGENIEIGGIEYTVSSTSTNIEIVLLGGANEVSLAVGEEVTVGGNTVRVEGVGNDGANDQLTLTVNGETDEIQEGTSQNVGGVDVFAKTVAVFNTEANPGYAVIQVGSDEIHLIDGGEVQLGKSSSDTIEGTEVTITGAVDRIQIAITAEDNDFDHLSVGDSFVDPVFGTVKLTFADAVNTEGNEIELFSSEDDTLGVTFEDESGDEASIEFIDVAATPVLADAEGDVIIVVEGQSATEDDYIAINSGDKEFLFEVKNIGISSGTDANAYVSLKDIFSGETHRLEYSNTPAGAGDVDEVIDTVTIQGQTFTIQAFDGEDNGADTWNSGDESIIMVDAGSAADINTDNTFTDPAGSVQVFPLMEIFSGTDGVGIAFTDDNVVAIDEADAGTTYTMVLPTGTVTVVTPVANACIATYTASTGDSEASADFSGGETEVDLTVGDAIYVFGATVTAGGADCATGGVDFYDVDVSLDDDNLDDGTTDELAEPALLIVEEDNDNDGDIKNTIIISTSADGSSGDIEVNTGDVIMSNQGIGFTSMDDSDFSTAYSSYGSRLLHDSSNSDHSILTVWTAREQLYAELLIAEESATIGSPSGSATSANVNVGSAVLDNEIASLSAQNTIIVGGPCANTKAAEFMGNPAVCSEGFVEGKAIIKVKDMGEYTAMLVAGYSGDDTRRAARVLAQYTQYAMSGTEVEVSGTDLSSITVAQPSPVVMDDGTA